MNVHIDRAPPLYTVTIDRPSVRNAVDASTALELAAAFRAFDAAPEFHVAILTGAAGHFSAGADLKAIMSGSAPPRVAPEGDGPLGCTRLRVSKPVLAAVEGFAVAGGLELALFCDMRIASKTARFGVFCRRFGVPLVDLGTVRLPRIIGHGRAMDLILTGREVDAEEALAIGLVNEVTEPGEALTRATAVASMIAGFPQTCVRNDRLSAIEQWDLDEDAAMKNELRRGLATLASGEMLAGAAQFAAGAGRHGRAI